MGSSPYDDDYPIDRFREGDIFPLLASISISIKSEKQLQGKI
jgi:hypothetical protein